MATEFVALGAQGRNKGQDTAIVVADANGIEYKLKANSTTGSLEIVKAGTVVSTIGKTAGAVTQITTAATGVTVNATKGAITTVTQNIAAAGEVQFTVTNSSVAVGDTPVVAIRSGSTGGTTIAAVTAVAAGSFQITLTNLHASVAETGTLIINFAVS